MFKKQAEFDRTALGEQRLHCRARRIGLKRNQLVNAAAGEFFFGITEHVPGGTEQLEISVGLGPREQARRLFESRLDFPRVTLKWVSRSDDDGRYLDND
jgi:hypothetical protein